MTSEEIRKQLAQQQANANKQAAAAPAAPDLQGKVNDHSDYINEMHRAQQEAARAELEAAYKQNVAAIDRAGVGVDKTYQDAKNQTTGASEQAKRNFAQYATANGLNNGAGGQAELARSVELQKALGALDKQKAQTVADLDLQRTNAETDFNAAIAKAKAEGNYQLAQALYQEKVRVEDAVRAALQQEYQNALNKHSMDYQVGRDTVNDLINQYQLAYQQEQDALAQDNYLKGVEYQKQQDALAQENYLKEFAYQQTQDKLAQDNYLKELAYQQGRDQVADSQWQKQYDFAKQQYIDQLALEYSKNAGETSWGSAGTPTGNGGVIENTGGKSVAEVAKEVIAGQWGNGAARKSALEQAGYDYNAVQSAVDSLLAGGGAPSDNVGAGISENPFTSFLTLTKYQVGNGFENAAYANVEKMWPQLSPEQKNQVDSLLADMGF